MNALPFVLTTMGAAVVIGLSVIFANRRARRGRATADRNP